MIRVAVIGDLFVRAHIFADALRRSVEPVVADLTLTCMEVGWPDVPPVHNDEIVEFVGDPQEIAAFVADAHAIVTQVAPLPRSVIENARQLQIIGCARGGPVSVNIAAATERGIPVVHAPGANAQAVVEFTLGLILAECKGIGRVHCALVDGVWRGDLYRYPNAGRELAGQTIGLIGFGNIGQMLVPYLRPFDMRVLAYDPYVTLDRFAELGVERADLSTLLQESDIVSLHARVTPETVGMMGEAEFAHMKPGAYFINTARGPLVDYDALYAALSSGQLGGAGLDTFALEPPPADWPLLKLDNVTVTPHIAGASQETAHRKAEAVVHDIANFYAGRPLQHCANPAALGARG